MLVTVGLGISRKYKEPLPSPYTSGYDATHEVVYDTRTCVHIRPSVDGLCRDGPSEISRDPRTKRLQTQSKRLGWL